MRYDVTLYVGYECGTWFEYEIPAVKAEDETEASRFAEDTFWENYTADNSPISFVGVLNVQEKDGFGHDDECPMCQNGTLEDNGEELVCRGECGSIL